jgi:outer membrane protein TolC
MSSRDPAAQRRARLCATALALLAASFFAPGVFAGTAAISLPQAIERAVQRAPLLDARRADVLAADEEAARAGALPDPMLTVGIDNLPVTGADAFDSSAEDMTMKKIGVRQEIPARAKREARKAFASHQIDEARARVIAETLSVRRAAAEAWIDVWATQRELAALTALRDEATLAANLAKARVAGGASVDDALATQAAVLDIDNRLEALRATQQSAQAGLARWVGDDDVEATSDEPDFGSLPIPEARMLAAVDQSGPLLPASAQVESAAAALDMARAEKRSDWSVAASYGQRSAGRSDMVMLEVGIGLPLFARNRQDRGVAAREADYQGALATREDLRRQEAARIRADLARWQGLKRQVALHEDSLLPLARDRSTTALASYRAGGPLQTWLDARRDELDAHLSHAEHLGELGRAWAALAYLLSSETQP